MIARIWRGWTTAADADDYVSYLAGTGLKDYRATQGNQSAWLLRRVQGETAEFLTVSVWDSLDAISAFAGGNTEQAVFYPEDEHFLIKREETVSHYELFEF
jgi:heme-degrading monooxygenase HmoA